METGFVKAINGGVDLVIANRVTVEAHREINTRLWRAAERAGVADAVDAGLTRMFVAMAKG